MIARGDLVAEIVQLRSYQPLHCKQLFRGNHFVGAPSKKVHWKPEAREVNLLPQGDEASAGEFVALVSRQLRDSMFRDYRSSKNSNSRRWLRAS